jgi:drug/metabolite transporter (DMT)-like permease
MKTAAHPPLWKTLSAFAVLYLVWGSTYFAIRVSITAIAPTLMGAIRFLIAGGVLYGWSRARGERAPTKREWASIALIGFLIFVCDYGVLFWTELRVPSGLAAAMMATIPAFMALSEIVILRTQKLTLRLAVALLICMGGVSVLVSRSLNLGGAPIDRLGALSLIFAAISFSVAASLIRKLPLPPSKVMSAGAQTLAGGFFLAVIAAALGDLQNFHPAAVSPEAWLALGYLTAAGSILAYTVYVWLLHHESPTKVGTYAYVNPVVAVAIGYFLGNEPLGARTILGTALILISVVLITLTKTN